MFISMKTKSVSLKNRYYKTYFFCIVLPILLILLFTLIAITIRFESQAEDNIRRMHDSLITELTMDIERESLKLSHLVHTNSNELLDYASLADTDETQVRYENYVRLSENSNLALEPSTNLVSLSFYMLDKKDISLISQVNIGDVRIQKWYLDAKENKNHVYVGYYPVVAKDEVFLGSKRTQLLLIFALSPDITTDRHEKIENIVIYYATDVSDKIEQYNKAFSKGKNRLGYTQIVDESGHVVYSSDGENHAQSRNEICISTPIHINNTIWYIESYIGIWKLMDDVWTIASASMLVAILVLLLSAFFSRFLIRDIVKPIERISDGFKYIEEGQLDVHIEPQGQKEIRNLIYQFNAMTKRIKALIGEYEEKTKKIIVSPEELMKAMISDRLTSQEVSDRNPGFFADCYVLFLIHIDQTFLYHELIQCLERNPRFVSRCVAVMNNDKNVIVKYRVMEDQYEISLLRMIEDLQKETEKQLNINIDVCISNKGEKPDQFKELLLSISNYMDYRYLYGKHAVIDLRTNGEYFDKIKTVCFDERYQRLAQALYIADEKNAIQERESICDSLRGDQLNVNQAQIILLALILMIGRKFGENGVAFSDIFGETINYMEKIERMTDLRSMKLWVTNYCEWIMDYSTEKLQISDTDVIAKAKRYIAQHYEEPDFALKEVANCVGLNENYFTNRFTKETGETFSTYVTTMRMQKSEELLKTTQFKVYEVAELVGYRNVEHFNRVFKKMHGVTPAQYRKSKE